MMKKGALWLWFQLGCNKCLACPRGRLPSPTSPEKSLGLTSVNTAFFQSRKRSLPVQAQKSTTGMDVVEELTALQEAEELESDDESDVGSESSYSSRGSDEDEGIVEVRCPTWARPGSVIEVQVPGRGDVFEATVPMGVRPGDIFDVRL